MKNKNLSVFLGSIALSVLPTLGHAAIYKCVDSKGFVTYSNVEKPGCNLLTVEPVQKPASTVTQKAPTRSSPPVAAKKREQEHQANSVAPEPKRDPLTNYSK